MLGLGAAALARATRAPEPGVSTIDITIGQNITPQDGRNDYGKTVMGGI